MTMDDRNPGAPHQGGTAGGRRRALALLAAAWFFAGLAGGRGMAQEAGFILEGRHQVAAGALRSLAFAPDGSWLLALAGNQAKVIGLGARGEIQKRSEIAGLRKEPVAAAVAPSGELIAITDRGGALYLYRSTGPAPALALVAAVPDAHRGAATAVTFTADGSYVASGGEDGRIRLWTPAGQPFAELGHRERRARAVLLLAPLGGDRRLLAIDRGHRIALWQADTQQALRESQIDFDILSAATGNDGKALALGLQQLTGNRSALASPLTLAREIDSDDRVRLIDGETGTELRDLEGEHQDLAAVAVSPDGRFVAAAGSAASVTVWDAASGKRITQIPCEDAVTALSFSPDGRRLVVGTRHGSLAVFAHQGVAPVHRPEPRPEILLALMEPSGVAGDSGAGGTALRGPPLAVDGPSLRVRGRIKSASPLKSLLVDGQEITSLTAESADSYIFNAYVALPSAGPHQVEILVSNQSGATARRVFAVARAAEVHASPPGPGRRIALIVGISHYAEPAIDLAFAADDARAMYKALTNPALGPAAFQAQDVRLLLDRQATVGAINTGLREFLRQARENDFVVFFFAGHGAPDPNHPQDLYLVAHDTRVKDLAGTGLLMRHVREAIADIPARDVLILTDACHSAGIAAPANGSRGLETNPINQAFLEKMKHASGGLAILTASEAAQLSQEDARWGNHGVFTHFLLQGLAGAADRNGDHIVTLGELMEYVRENVRRATRDEQIPAVGPTSFDRGLPLVTVPKSEGRPPSP